MWMNSLSGVCLENTIEVWIGENGVSRLQAGIEQCLCFRLHHVDKLDILGRPGEGLVIGLCDGVIVLVGQCVAGLPPQHAHHRSDVTQLRDLIVEFEAEDKVFNGI
jgi:hypothetical protein